MSHKTLDLLERLQLQAATVKLKVERREAAIVQVERAFDLTFSTSDVLEFRWLNFMMTLNDLRREIMDLERAALVFRRKGVGQAAFHECTGDVWSNDRWASMPESERDRVAIIAECAGYAVEFDKAAADAWEALRASKFADRLPHYLDQPLTEIPAAWRDAIERVCTSCKAGNSEGRES